MITGIALACKAAMASANVGFWNISSWALLPSDRHCKPASTPMWSRESGLQEAGRNYQDLFLAGGSSSTIFPSTRTLVSLIGV